MLVISQIQSRAMRSWKLNELPPEVLQVITVRISYYSLMKLAVLCGDMSLSKRLTSLSGVRELNVLNKSDLGSLMHSGRFLVPQFGSLTHLTIKVGFKYADMYRHHNWHLHLPRTMLEIRFAFFGCWAFMTRPLDEKLDGELVKHIYSKHGYVPLLLDETFPHLQLLHVIDDFVAPEESKHRASHRIFWSSPSTLHLFFTHFPPHIHTLQLKSVDLAIGLAYQNWLMKFPASLTSLSLLDPDTTLAFHDLMRDPSKSDTITAWSKKITEEELILPPNLNHLEIGLRLPPSAAVEYLAASVSFGQGVLGVSQSLPPNLTHLKARLDIFEQFQASSSSRLRTLHISMGHAPPHILDLSTSAPTTLESLSLEPTAYDQVPKVIIPPPSLTSFVLHTLEFFTPDIDVDLSSLYRLQSIIFPASCLVRRQDGSRTLSHLTALTTLHLHGVLRSHLLLQLPPTLTSLTASAELSNIDFPDLLPLQTFTRVSLAEFLMNRLGLPLLCREQSSITVVFDDSLRSRFRTEEARLFWANLEIVEFADDFLIPPAGQINMISPNLHTLYLYNYAPSVFWLDLHPQLRSLHVVTIERVVSDDLYREEDQVAMQCLLDDFPDSISELSWTLEADTQELQAGESVPCPRHVLDWQKFPKLLSCLPYLVRLDLTGFYLPLSLLLEHPNQSIFERLDSMDVFFANLIIIEGSHLPKFADDIAVIDQSTWDRHCLTLIPPRFRHLEMMFYIEWTSSSFFAVLPNLVEQLALPCAADSCYTTEDMEEVVLSTHSFPPSLHSLDLSTNTNFFIASPGELLSGSMPSSPHSVSSLACTSSDDASIDITPSPLHYQLRSLTINTSQTAHFDIFLRNFSSNLTCLSIFQTDVELPYWHILESSIPPSVTSLHLVGAFHLDALPQLVNIHHLTVPTVDHRDSLATTSILPPNLESFICSDCRTDIGPPLQRRLPTLKELQTENGHWTFP